MRRRLLILCCLCVPMLTGCIVSQVDPGTLELNGKIAWVCSAPAAVVGVGVDALFLPLTVPEGIVFWWKGISRPSPFMVPSLPGALFEYGVYEAVAALSYPVQVVVVDVPRRVTLSFKSDEAARQELNQQFPRLRDYEYSRLVATSGRAFAPAYDALAENEGDMESPLSGSRQVLVTYVVDDWEAWRAAGRPKGGPAEASIVLQYWIMEGDPPRRGPLWEAQLHVIERTAGVYAAEVERYASEHQDEQRSSGYGPWKFWIVQHGGVEAVALKAQGGKRR